MRKPWSQEPFDAGVDIHKLGVAVGMRRPFASLAIGLQAVSHLAQQRGHGPRPHRMISLRQFFGQTPGALASPAERRLGVATYPRLQQRLQSRQQPRVGFLQRWATAPGPSHSGRLRDALWRWLVQFPQAGGDRGAGQTSRAGHQRNTAPAQVARLSRSPLPSHPLVHFRNQQLILPPNPCDDWCVLHSALLANSDRITNSNL